MRIQSTRVQDQAAPARKANPFSDGLQNIVTRTGVGAGNVLSAGRYSNTRLYTRIELEAMYSESWVVGKVVDIVAKDMVRAGITIQSGATPEDSKKLLTGLTRLGLWRSMLNALRWGRLYGGAIGMINIDGQNPATPLRLETVGRDQFRGLRVFDRHQLTPDVHHLVQEGMHEGTPLFYDVVPANEAMVSHFRVHHSRVIRCIGHELPPWQTTLQELWGAPIVSRFFDRLLAFDSGTMGAANLLSKAHIRHIGVENLRQILSEGGEAEKDVLKMFALMAIMQHNEAITLTDSADTYTPHTYTFAGLDDILLSFGQQLSGASDIPLVKFFGQAPKGLNATGESDLRLYYDGISTQQESDLRDGLDTILRVAHQSMLGCPAPDEFEFVFAPLWQMSASEKAEVAGKITETINVAVSFGLPQDVALRELQQQSEETGIFTNVTDQVIEAAVLPAVPTPEQAMAAIEAFNAGGTPPVVPGAGAETDLAKVQQFTGTAGPSDTEKVKTFARGTIRERIRAFVQG